jgi:hypothetical protein
VFALGTRLLPGIRMPGRETCEAFWEGGPRKRDGGGSLCLPLLLDVVGILENFSRPHMMGNYVETQVNSFEE